MAGQQRGARNPSQRGDFTGNQKEVLQRQHEDAVNERRDELGLVTAGQQAIKDEGVIDLTSGQPVLEGTDKLIDTAARQPGVVEQEEVPEEGTRIGSGTSTYDVMEMPDEKPKALAQAGEVLTPDLLNSPTLVRALYDLEDITIGYGNTFTFREGYRYRVPRWVAQHLEEKNLALVLSLSPA